MVEKNILEEFKPDEIEIPIPGEKKIEVDLSDVKIWNRKLKGYLPVKPQGLIVFPENIGKCWKCGFYKRVCMCNETEHEKKSKISSFKVRILQWIEKIKMKYHEFRYNRLMQKANKIEERAEKRVLIYRKKAIIHREFRESKTNWKEVKFEGIEIKQNRGI